MAGDCLEGLIVKTVLTELKSRSGFDHWWDPLEDDVKEDVITHLETQVNAVLEEMGL